MVEDFLLEQNNTIEFRWNSFLDFFSYFHIENVLNVLQNIYIM
jgi:hypothetical protein